MIVLAYKNRTWFYLNSFQTYVVVQTCNALYHDSCCKIMVEIKLQITWDSWYWWKVWQHLVGGNIVRTAAGHGLCACWHLLKLDPQFEWFRWTMVEVCSVNSTTIHQSTVIWKCCCAKVFSHLYYTCFYLAMVLLWHSFEQGSSGVNLVHSDRMWKSFCYNLVATGNLLLSAVRFLSYGSTQQQHFVKSHRIITSTGSGLWLIIMWY